jgi:hypothetical protein
VCNTSTASAGQIVVSFAPHLVQINSSTAPRSTLVDVCGARPSNVPHVSIRTVRVVIRAIRSPHPAGVAAMNPIPRKVVIIGAGIAGLCAAVHARKCGYAVTVLEQHERPSGHSPPAGSVASIRSTLVCTGCSGRICTTPRTRYGAKCSISTACISSTRKNGCV